MTRRATPGPVRERYDRCAMRQALKSSMRNAIRDYTHYHGAQFDSNLTESLIKRMAGHALAVVDRAFDKLFDEVGRSKTDKPEASP
jgi:hypothetical protein